MQCKHQRFSFLFLHLEITTKSKDNSWINTSQQWVRTQEKVQSKPNKDVENKQKQTVLLLEGARHQKIVGELLTREMLSLEEK